MAPVSGYSYAIAREFCERLAVCELGMEAVCREMNLVPRTVWRWLNSTPEFWDMYTKARDFQTELLYDEISKIAYLPLEDDDGRRLSAGDALAEVNRRKLIIDTLKFKLAKLQPKRFGDNKNVSVDHNVKHLVSPEQFQRMLEAASDATVDIEAEEVE